MFSSKNRPSLEIEEGSSRHTYERLSPDPGTPVACGVKWKEKFSEQMYPTKQVLERSKKMWHDASGQDAREEFICFRAADIVVCRMPILLFGLFNCLYAAPVATVKTCQSDTVAAPASLEMK